MAGETSSSHARRIHRIVEQHRLAREARALRDEIAKIKADLQSLHHRGHNNPPELVEETIAVMPAHRGVAPRLPAQHQTFGIRGRRRPGCPRQDYPDQKNSE